MKTNIIPPARRLRRRAVGSRGWAAATALTVGGAVLGGTFSSDFSSDPGGIALQNNPSPVLVEDGYLKLVDLQDFTDGITGLPIQASYIFPEIEPDRVAAFTATFKVRIGGGTERSSQGLSFVLANDYPDDVPFREAGGATLGLVISFDTIDGLTGPSSVTEGNDPGAAPGIIIRQGGKTVTYQRFDGLRTGDNFVPVEVKLEEDGTLDVTYNGEKVYDNVPIGYLPIAGRFAFGAGTEEITSANRDNFWVDDLTITTTPVSGAYLSSVLPLVQDAPPNAAVVIAIEGLGGGATTMTFDGSPVEPTRETVGTTTTLTYDPPGLLEPGSTHQIVLTYAGKTFSYGFTVISAAVLPATAAVAADTVNLSSDGFSLQVYQVETLPGTTSYAVSEAVLAGQAGDNIADLSGATGGIFERTLVNFEQDAFEAGFFTGLEGYPDDYIPGIPGTFGTTDNIAAAVTGVLDLQPGAYTIGSVSDDNMRIAIGGDPRDLTALKLVEVNIGTASGTFIVQQAGLYPFRAVWGEGGGGAHFELWSEAADGTRILLNDRATPGHLKSYSRRSATYRGSPYVSSASPAPGELNVSTQPRITLGLTDDPGATVVSDSIKVLLNGAEVSSSSTKEGSLTTVTTQVAAPLGALESQTVAVEFSDSNGQTVRREYTFTTGKSAGGNLANAVKGYWTFDQGNLNATIGRDLQYIDAALSSRYTFGTTTTFGLPDLDGQAAQVLHIPYSGEDPREVFSKLGLRLNHGIAPNGGGTKVNQWTLILDVLWGPESQGFGGLLQTHDLNDPTDGDLFWRRSDGSYGKGCCSSYDELPTDRSHQPGEWARIVFVADIGANPPRLAKYINGYKHREDVTGDGGAIDGRYSLPPEVFLFGDGDDNERTEAFVNAIQIREGILTDDEVAALGGPSSHGIPIPYAQWDFDQGNLAATVGNDAQFIDPALASRYTFGTTTQFGIPDIDGQPAQVLHIPYSADDPREVFSKLGLRVNHGLGINGGGTKLNRWTLILDVLWGPESQGFGGLLQTHDLNDPTDGDLFWRRSDGSYGKGCCSNYDDLPVAQSHQQGEWARIVFVADITADPPRFAKYINGYKHREDVTGDGGALDGRYSLPSEIFLFGDGDDNERTEAYVNSIQLRSSVLTDDEVAALGGPSAAGIPTPNPVKGEWNFDQGTLAATVGTDLQYIDAALSSRYTFGTTTTFGLPDLDGQAAQVLHIPYSAEDPREVFSKLGLRMNHGIAPNGGGTKVNQWTLILDVLWGPESQGFGGLLQTHDLNDPTDGDLFWRRSDGSYGKGCCSNYDDLPVDRSHQSGEWARIVFVADIAANPPRLAKYINGYKHREDVTGDGGAIDGRYSLPSEVFLFGDGDDNERTEAFVNAIQIREGILTDDEVAALGGPSAHGIPGASIGSIAVVPPPDTGLLASGTLGGSYAAITATVDSSAKSITTALPADTTFYRVSGSGAVVITSIAVEGNQLVIRYQ